MKESFIDFETAKLAKEKGFAWRGAGVPGVREEVDGAEPLFERRPCYNAEGLDIAPKFYNPKNPHYPRPTLGLMQAWLRARSVQVYCVPSVLSSSPGCWTWCIVATGLSGQDGVVTEMCQRDSIYDSYEESLGKGLLEGLRLI
jgi:hypothetical protein